MVNLVPMDLPKCGASHQRNESDENDLSHFLLQNREREAAAHQRASLRALVRREGAHPVAPVASLLAVEPVTRYRL